MDVGFRGGIDLSQQVLPTDASYLYLPKASESIAAARRAVVEWNELELRRKALAILQSYELDVDGGQEQLFIVTSAVTASMEPAMNRLRELLRSAG